MISKKTYLTITFLFFLFTAFQQFSKTENLIGGETEYYLKGIEALKEGDTDNAEKFFKMSVRQFNDAASFHELGKIYLKQNTFRSRAKAYENFRQAVLNEPENIEYRFSFALLMKEFARKSSENQFKEIIRLDSSHVQAWIKLGEIKNEDFSEYNNSFIDMGSDFLGSLQEFADEDFTEAETYYLSSLKFDSTNYAANLGLAMLYEKINRPEKGIPFLYNLINNKKADSDIYLCMGLLFYKTRNMKDCHESYKTALSLMTKEIRDEFTFESVKLLLEPAYGKAIEDFSDYEIKQFIETYWKVNEPLYLTEYNERLLEHYSRVAFANLHFKPRNSEKSGWKTDRGEAVLRYGEPLNFMRLRPQMSDNGVSLKTEIWNYENLSFGFTDLASSGNYQFSVPDAPESKVHTQFAGDSQFLFEDLKRLQHTFYKPKFEGPELTVPYMVHQFKSFERRNNTDIYFTFEIDNPDSLFGKNELIEIKAGAFFYDKNYEQHFKKIMPMTFENEKSKTKNSISVTAMPDSGYYSFEIIREKDRAVFADKKNLKLKKFGNYILGISDLILADSVFENSNRSRPIQRNKIGISPNINGEFTKLNMPFIYYETYNLMKGKGGLTNFEQKIIISHFDEEPDNGFAAAIKAVADLLGLSRKSEIILTSKYQTFESDPQIYLQIDLSGYRQGKYLVVVEIRDLISNSSAASASIIDWKN